MSVSTIANTTAVAKVTSVLASAQLEKAKLFNAPLWFDERFPKMITTERIIIEKIYNKDPNYTNLQIAADYLYDLCGGFIPQAQAIVNANSGTPISPATPATVQNPYYFIVTSASTPMKTGDTTHTFTEFIGFNLIFTRGGINQTQVVSEPTYFSWNRVTGAFVCSPALVDDELLGIIPV